MATATNFTIDGRTLGGMRSVWIATANPIDALGNQRGLTGAVVVKGVRYADVPTAKILKAYIGRNGHSIPIGQVSFELRDNANAIVATVTLRNAVVVEWGMKSPEPPVSTVEGAIPVIEPDVETFTLHAYHVTFQSGGDNATYQRPQPAAV